jgi:hypothetical protein
MKPQTFFRLALLVPYHAVGHLLACASPPIRAGDEISETWNFILIPITFYAIGIILWFFPYTMLAISLGFWAKNKAINSNSATWHLQHPFLFTLLMLAEIIMVNLPADKPFRLIRQLQINRS